MLTDYAIAGASELWNTTRLQAYLTNVGSPFDSGPDICVCPGLTPAIIDGAGTTYVTPVADPAPWYDVDYDHSGEFLGFLPLSIVGLDDNPRARGVTNAVGGGGVFSGMRDLPRTLTVTGLLLGTTCCGADYGLHYLSEVLASCTAAGCGGNCLSMYSCCPDDGMTKEQFDAKYRRTFFGASLISGPTVTARSANGGSCNEGGCRGGEIITVEFVIVAANPWPWTDAEPRLDVPFPETGEGDCVEWCVDSVDGACDGEPCLFRDCDDGGGCQDPLATFAVPPQPTAPDTVFCAALVPERACYTIDLTDRPRWSEDVPVVTVRAGGDELRNIRIVFYENANPAVPCDETADLVQCVPVNDFQITYVPPNGEVTIDGRTGEALTYCGGTDCEQSTTVYGDQDGGPLRISGLTCGSYCVCIETDSNFPPATDATVTIETSGRGL